MEVEQKKEDANSAREHGRKAKRRSKASSNFSFDFVDDADSSEKVAGGGCGGGRSFCGGGGGGGCAGGCMGVADSCYLRFFQTVFSLTLRNAWHLISSSSHLSLHPHST